MVTDDIIGTDVEDILLKDEARWFEQVPPELEWDESDLALVVQDLVGESRMHNYY